MRQRRSLLTIMLLGCLMVLLWGCGSTKPSRFYTLAATGTPGTLQQGTAESVSTVVALGPVNIPDYLDRPQIVIRTGNSEIHFDEFERWAGSLKDSIPRILAQNLSDLLPPGRFTVIPWKPLYSLRMTVTAAYRVTVLVQEFEGTLGGKAVLRVLWTVSNERDSTILYVRESSYAEEVGGNDYTSLVAAMSKALGRLSSDIAALLRTLPQDKAASGAG